MVRELEGLKFEDWYDNIVSYMSNCQFPTAENHIDISQLSSPNIAVLAYGRNNNGPSEMFMP